MIVLVQGLSFGQNILPKITMGLEESTGPSDFVLTMQIVFLITILSLAPSILIMMTSFTRLVIVFHFLRSCTFEKVESREFDYLFGSVYLTSLIMHHCALIK